MAEPRPPAESRGPATPRVVTVPRDRGGERIDRFLARELPATPERVRALCEAGRVRIRGKACAPLRRLHGGETIEVSLPPPRAASPAPVEPELPVLHDAGGVLVVDKPAGFPVEPAGPSSPSVVGGASGLGGFGVGGVAAPGLPHRLDRDTTGCLVLARTDAALAALRAAFEAGEVEKTYLALVAGAPPDEGRLDTPYARDPSDPRRFTTRVPSPRRARLSFRVERRLPGAALLRVRLETGRTHQIRVQLAEAGWPVVGDATYGVTSAAIPRQALHAWRIAFPAPVPAAFPAPGGGARVEVEAPLPADLASALRLIDGSAR